MTIANDNAMVISSDHKNSRYMHRQKILMALTLLWTGSIAAVAVIFSAHKGKYLCQEGTITATRRGARFWHL